MKRQNVLMLALVAGFVAAACMQPVAVDTKAPRISKEELMAIMNRPDLTIVDVRVEGDWKASDRRIAGAVREDPEKDVKGWANKYPKNRDLVFY
jgi:hypothetical protein